MAAAVTLGPGKPVEALERTDATAKLTCRGVRKSYGDVVALAATDLTMSQGEFLTLLGPSGSGKTTLLMMIAGLSPVDGGEIWIDDVRASHLPSYARDIGMVFQSYALFPHMTVFENIAFPLRMRRRPEAEIRTAVAAALEMVQLPHVAQRLPRELSGGQQQRIALARCFVYRPSIILMDEPLGALDKKLRDQMQYEIKQLQREVGATVLYVTHDQEEAMAMSDRICLMNRGGIEQIGTPEDLYFRPVSLFAADFLGESNLFPGRVASLGRPAAVELGGRTIAVPALPADARAGGPVTVMVRPERVRVVGAGDPEGFAGTVRSVNLLAGVTRVVVDLDVGVAATVKMLTGVGVPPRTRARVGVAWPTDAVVAITRETTRA